MAVPGTGGYLGWQYPVFLFVLCSSPNVYSVYFSSVHPLRSQHSPSKLAFWLYLCPTFILYSNLCPLFHPPPTTQCEHPWYYLTHPTSLVFYLIWWELLQTATSIREALKHSEMVHLLCKILKSIIS